ncbi:DUF1810 domain-containing protein [Pedobacter sp. UC225_61]|uniref:DUF1810 domain-containing protein n=1 Tax=Pedobacter sp. UC225_61 TaxID=3374623 RepID=UPI0037946898
MTIRKAKLEHYVSAQNQSYASALQEIKNGRKTSHWMWFIFPQLQGLGHSEMSIRYGIESLDHASTYLSHPILGQRLIEIASAVLQSNIKNATQMMGSPDDLKLHSSMTLFNELSPTNPVFNAVLIKFFKGEKDPRTLALLSRSI